MISRHWRGAAFPGFVEASVLVVDRFTAKGEG
jgi:hypothetical protein